MNLSQGSTPSTSDDDASESVGSAPSNSSPRHTAISNNRRQSSAPAANRGFGAPRRSPTIVSDSAATIGRIPTANSTAYRDQNFDEAIADARKELSKIRQRELSSRPLRITRQDPERRPDSILSERFQRLANDELKIRRLNVKDWLRVATWWLLKVHLSSLTLGLFSLTVIAGKAQYANI